jgi:DNA repair photolyase
VETYRCTMKRGIARSRQFEKKRLAEFAINTGLKCGNGCLYCSTPSLVRTHPYFRSIGRTAFEQGYAIVDPDSPERVKVDAQRMKKRGLIQLCTISDAWSSEAWQLQLGRKCLKAVLEEPGWTVRILTKNAAVADDFDLIERYRDRVTIGLSVTGTLIESDMVKVVEPHASPIDDRIAALQEAQRRGLRTYAMLCPLLPSIASSPGKIDELVCLAEGWGAAEFFAEPVNPRGPGLKLTQTALENGGYPWEAISVGRIRTRESWSRYVVELLKNIQCSMRKHSDISKLRFLLYPKQLMAQDLAQIKNDDKGVVWL